MVEAGLTPLVDLVCFNGQDFITSAQLAVVCVGIVQTKITAGRTHR